MSANDKQPKATPRPGRQRATRHRRDAEWELESTGTWASWQAHRDAALVHALLAIEARLEQIAAQLDEHTDELVREISDIPSALG